MPGKELIKSKTALIEAIDRWRMVRASLTSRQAELRNHEENEPADTATESQVKSYRANTQRLIDAVWDAQAKYDEACALMGRFAEAENIGVKYLEGSWDYTFAAITELPVLDGPKPRYSLEGEESWHGTWQAIDSLPTIVPEREIASRAEAGVEPICLPENVKVTDTPSQGVIKLSVPHWQYQSYLDRLRRLQSVNGWYANATRARMVLTNAYKATKPDAPYIDFAYAGDASVWLLLSNPDFDTLVPGA